MKECRIRFSSMAYDDLAAALKNIRQVSENAANRFLSDLDRQTDYLKTMPKMYPVDESHPPHRRMVLDDYLVLYTVDEQTHEVKIRRILTARMNPARFFS